jgi:hypothetical protein
MVITSEALCGRLRASHNQWVPRIQHGHHVVQDGHGDRLTGRLCGRVGRPPGQPLKRPVVPVQGIKKVTHLNVGNARTDLASHDDHLGS